jgi:hypothetical protein
MTDYSFNSDAEADEMMGGILVDAEDPMSPVLTPFFSLGSDDPGDGMVESASAEQAGSRDLWQTFSS